MAYTLNTSHPLYGNLVELIGVQGGALVSLVTGRTFTMQSGSSFGTGALGEHMKTGAKGYSSSGANFSPSVTVPGAAAAGHSTFIAVNNVAAGPDIGAGAFVNMYGSASNYALSPGLSGANIFACRGYSSFGANAAASIVGAGAQSLCVTRTQESAHTVLHNGVLKASGAMLGYNNTDTYDNIGGPNGQGCAGGIEFVWIVWLNKALSEAETLSLHNSLGANNAFGLVMSGGGNAAPTFPGPNIGNLTGTVGTALTSNNVSGKFSDSDALTFSAVGSWPAGVTVSSAGVISGTPTTAGTYSSLKVRATDTAAQTVDSNAFSFTVSAAVSFTIPEPLENNAGSLWLNQAVVWTWTPNGRIGSMSGKSPADGTGTLHATTGLMTASYAGMPAGAGCLDIAILGATPDLDAVYHVTGTAA